jgi:hypothetical protein
VLFGPVSLIPLSSSSSSSSSCGSPRRDSDDVATLVAIVATGGVADVEGNDRDVATKDDATVVLVVAVVVRWWQWR